MEILQQIAATWGIPTALMGFLVWLLERKYSKREKLREDREETRRKRQETMEINLVKSINATMALGEATARAVQRIPDAHCNGDMKAALEYEKKIKHEQKDFLTSLGIQALHDE